MQNSQDGATPYTENAHGRSGASNENFCAGTPIQALNLSPDAVKEISEILRSLPGTFSGSLVQHMTRKKYTVESLAETSLASSKTIQRMRSDESYTPKLGTIVAICIGLQLHPVLSADLIRKAGLSFKYTEEHTAYLFLLSTHFHSSIYDCNRHLERSLGITVGIDKVKAACESAKQNPAEENSFRQLRLNQWVKQAVRWMPMAKWDACAFPVDDEALKGRVCYGGLDLSSTTDITAFVLVFPPEDGDGKYAILPFFWIPENNIDLRVRRDHVPYDLWEKQGYLLTTEGNVVHYGFIEQFVEKLGERYNICEIAFDRWGAVQMVQNLEGLGFTVVPFGQGFKDMSPPTKELMKLTLEQRIAHSGHPILRWMMDNIYIRTDPAGNIKPDKEKSTEKIDGAVATIMALDRAIRCGNDSSASVYDERGILIL